MKHRLLLTTTCIFVAYICSCKKSNNAFGAPGKDLQGYWAFVSVGFKSTSVDTVTPNTHKTETIVKYSSTDGGGIVAFSSDSIFATGLTYKLSGLSTSYVYENDHLLDSPANSFNFNLMPSNLSNPYKPIGADSLFFPINSFLSTGGLLGFRGPVAGSKYEIKGKILKITTNQVKDSTQYLPGYSVAVSYRSTVTVILNKQWNYKNDIHLVVLAPQIIKNSVSLRLSTSFCSQAVSIRLTTSFPGALHDIALVYKNV